MTLTGQPNDLDMGSHPIEALSAAMAREAEGRTMTLDEAVSLALKAGEPKAGTPTKWVVGQTPGTLPE
jgi:hypothetical protein